MAEVTTTTPPRPQVEASRDAEDKKIASLRKAYEDAAKKVTEASKYADVPGIGVIPGYADLRARKLEAFNALHEAEEAKSKRERAALQAARSK